MNLPSHLVPLDSDLHLWTAVAHGGWGLANCLVIAPQSGPAALVDTPYTADLAQGLMDAVGRVRPAASISTVITTHANGDHAYTTGLYPAAEIISTRSAREHACLEPSPDQLHELVHHGDRNTPLGRYLHQHFGRFDWSGLKPAPPTRTFDGALSLEVGGIPVELIEVGPAHTVGDLIVHLPRHRTVCAGDVVFIGDHPVHWAGPLQRVIDACRRIRSLSPQTIVPGHGPVIGPEELDRHISYLEGVRDRIHAAHAKGLDAGAAATDLLRHHRGSPLGLPERLVILTAVEYRHLTGDTSRPSLPALVADAARHAHALPDGRNRPPNGS